jgi:hypothetical protein
MIAIHELHNEQAYEAELTQCVGVTGYHQWFFLQAIADALNLEFRAFAVEFESELLGVVPLLFRRRGPISTVNILPIGCIGPLIRGKALQAGLVRELLTGVEPVLRSHRTIATRWAFAPGLKVSYEHLAMPGFEVSRWDNYVVPESKSIDDCLKSMSRNRRQSIRRNERLVSVQQSSTEEITGWLPERVADTYDRQGHEPLYQVAEVRSLTERLATHPRMLWRTAKGRDGSVLAMTGCVIGDDRLWGWLMIGPRTPGISAQSLCYWDAIEWSRSRGLACDLGGVPNEGIRELKISMGADPETAVAALRISPRAAYKAGMGLYRGMDRLAKWWHGRDRAT